MADDRVPPQLKVDLFDAHERLGINGDARSNPLAAMDMVGRIAGGTAKQRDLYPMIGDSLSMADASTMAGLMKDPTRAKQLNETLQAANRYYAPNGDIAETRAMARFVDWLLPQVRQGAVLDPRNKDWVLGGPEGAEGFMNTFRVRGDDLLDRAVAPYDVLSRPALGDIFGVPARARIQKTADIKPLPMAPKDYMAEYEANQARVKGAGGTPAELPKGGKDYMSDYEANKRRGG